MKGRGYHPAAPQDSAPLLTDGARDWATWPGFGTQPSVRPVTGRLATVCHDVVSLGTTLPQVRAEGRQAVGGSGHGILATAP